MNTSVRIVPGLLAGVVALTLAAGTRAQSPLGRGAATDFSTSEYFDPPNENQPRFTITGAEAQPQPGGRYLLKQLQIETFRVTGEREIVVIAPECVYDSARGQAASSGRLDVQSGDGQFSVAGRGFLWQQDAGALTISNEIRSVIQRALTNAAAAAPLVITSRWFSFVTTNRHAVFHDDVRGEDAEMEFTCGQLAIHTAPNGESFELIEAGPNLIITGKGAERRATARRGIYTRSDERVELLGDVEWQTSGQSGRADRAVVLRLQNDAVAEGRVALKLPRESLGAGGALLGPTNVPAAEASPPARVDVFADQFHSRSNLTIARGNVRLVDGANQLNCDQLTVVSATDAAPEESATAEGNVVLTQGEATLRAARARYTQADAQMVFTGEPRWTQGQMEGRAERVTIHTDSSEFHADEQVVVQMPLASEESSFLTLFPAAADTNRAPQTVEIRSQEFKARERRALFFGDVRARQLPATGDESRLASDELEVRFAAATNRIQWLQARKNVVYEQGHISVTNGPAMHRKLVARALTSRANPDTGALADLVAEGDVQIEQPGNRAQGGRATYTAATEILELSDGPSLETTQLIITDAETLIWDKANERYAGTGRFKIKLKAAAVRENAEKMKTP